MGVNRPSFSESRVRRLVAIGIVGILIIVALMFIATLANMDSIDGGHEDEHHHSHEHDDELDSHDDRSDHADDHSNHNDGHSDHADGDDGGVSVSVQGFEWAGIEVETAKSRELEPEIVVNGVVVLDEDHTVRMVPRFPGTVVSVGVGLGTLVSKGQTLATIESSGSEASYNLTSLQSGEIISKTVTRGQVVDGRQTVFTVSNLSQIWVHLSIPERYKEVVTVGSSVEVRPIGSQDALSGKIEYLSNFLFKDSQTLLARVVVKNKLNWYPGMFVRAAIKLDPVSVPVAIRRSAVQTHDGASIVFLEDKEHPEGFLNFSVSIVEVVSADRGWYAVKGLNAGVRYVSRESFVLKAELEKQRAGHAH